MTTRRQELDKSKGQVEAEVSEALIKFEKEFMGRGPQETRTFIVDDMVLVRLRGVLTPAERNLVGHDTGMHGGDPHASDGIITNGDYLSMDGGKTWVHNERAIR